jgi:hypothetical protein
VNAKPVIFSLQTCLIFHMDLLLVFQIFAGNNQEVHNESLEVIHEVSRVYFRGGISCSFVTHKFFCCIWGSIFILPQIKCCRQM